MSATSINLFLADRSWAGLVVADAASQNAKVLSAPRDRLGDLLARDELTRSGVYVLTGPSSEGGFGLEGYIGESDALAQRLRRHDKEKTFWNRVYVAVAKDDWLSKSHIRFLEARLLAQAKLAPLMTKVVNEQKNLKYRVSEGDQASLLDFVGFLKIIMPAIGCPLYAFPDLGSGTGTGPAHVAGVQFEMTKLAARAVAFEKDGSFWVAHGSTARVEPLPSLRTTQRESRQDLLARGLLLLDTSRNVLVFTQDVPFKSPSEAAAVVGASSLNGRIEWKVLGAKTTYDEWHRSLPPA